MEPRWEFGAGWQHSVLTIQDKLDLSVLNLDGSHALAKKGGEAVAYQTRKRAKTSNILPITDHQGYVVATTDIVAGNHNDAFDLKPHGQAAFKAMKRLGLSMAGAYFNADSAFDTRHVRKVCFNHRVIPNIAENVRNRLYTKLGRKRLFDTAIYKDRFASQPTFAWIDKFRALVVRHHVKKIYFMRSHFLAFTLINPRNVLVSKVSFSSLTSTAAILVSLCLIVSKLMSSIQMFRLKWGICTV
jgi:hypothetical protein